MHSFEICATTCESLLADRNEIVVVVKHEGEAFARSLDSIGGRRHDRFHTAVDWRQRCRVAEKACLRIQEFLTLIALTARWFAAENLLIGRPDKSPVGRVAWTLALA